MESAGHAENYRAVIDGGCPEDEPVGLCQEAQQWACCTEDEGRSFGAGLQRKAPNSHELLQSKAVVVNVMVKRRDLRSRHVWVGETNESEPLETHRKFKDDIKTRTAD
jgi:hypothetical protein